MHKHSHFNLVLHDNSELESLLDIKISERQCLHEWPLSCVERIRSEKGQSWIYKTQQVGPTIEPQFYSQARSTLLVPGRVLKSTLKDHCHMLFPYLAAPLLSEQALSDQDALTIATTIVKRIAEIKGRLPYYLDISTAQRWTALMERMFETLSSLIARNEYQHVTTTLLKLLSKRAFAHQTLMILSQASGFVHHDLTADNILVLPDGYRVIDWQRPILGPPDLDLATLLLSMGHNPTGLVAEGLLWIMYLLRVHWFVACTVRWFPAGSAHYDLAIAELAEHFET